MLDSHHFTISESIAAPPQQWFALAFFIAAAAMFIAAFVMLYRIERRESKAALGLAITVSLLLIAVPCVSLNYSDVAHGAVAATLFVVVLALGFVLEFDGRAGGFGERRLAIARWVTLGVFTAAFICIFASASYGAAFASADVKNPAASLTLSIAEFVYALSFTLYLFLETWHWHQSGKTRASPPRAPWCRAIPPPTTITTTTPPPPTTKNRHAAPDAASWARDST